MTDYLFEQFEVVASQTLEESRYSDGTNMQNINLRYIIPKVNSIPSPSQQESITIATDRAVNNKHFSLSGQRESGNGDFTAKAKVDPTDSSADRSSGTLDVLITELEASTASGSTALADQLKARFGTDGSGNYIVRTIPEQRIWFREYIHNPGLDANYTLFGPSYDYRTVDGSNNPTGTPIDIQEADIDFNENNPLTGTGVLRFKLGGNI